MKMLSTVGANLCTQSLQEKFHHRLAARLRYQRPHKVTSITKSLRFHVHFTVHVLNIDFFIATCLTLKIHNLLHVDSTGVINFFDR